MFHLRIQKKESKQISSSSSQNNQNSSLMLEFSQPQQNLYPPAVSMVLPDAVSHAGDFTLALFGVQFEPSGTFRVRVSNKQGTQFVQSSRVEFHSSTSVVCHFDKFLMPAGSMDVQASNDGKEFGVGYQITLIDPLTSPVMYLQCATPSIDRQFNIMRSQLENVRRTVLQVQQLELDLSSKLEFLASGNALAYGPPPKQSQQSLQSSYAVDEGEEEPENNESAEVVMMNQSQLLDREIRLFISSPFVDMQKERDMVVKIVVPQIRRMCVERDIIFNFVDLRWGITDAQTSQATMILMCLRELQRSNLFVGCLGERYGYSLPTTKKSITSTEDKERSESFQRAFKLAAKEFPWLSEYSDRSITEIEMQDILRDETKANAAWFFLRDPYYLEEIPEAQREQYKSENEESSTKLEALKEEIESSSFPSYNYKRPEHFADLVVEELRVHIDSKYPQDQIFSDAALEQFRHQVYARTLTSVYLPDESEFVSIDKFVMNDNEAPLVISGATGTGKSALLANWAKRHQNQHPEDIIISHWVTCSPNASDHVLMIHRIMCEILENIQHYDSSVLSSLSDIKFLSPESQRQRILDEFPVWLERLFANKITNRFVLLIDGLDNIDDRDNALDFTWFPRSFPKGIRVLTAATDNEIHRNLTLKLLRKRNCPEIQLTPLNIGQKKSFISQYLQHKHGKKLHEKQELRIAESSQSANPRFLQTLLDEICVTATHENLDDRINAGLKAQNTAELYELVLSRIDSDYDVSHKGFIKSIFSLIAVSHKGLHCADELNLLMLRPNSQGKTLVTEEEFSTLYLLIGNLLSTAGGLLTFSNEDIAKAVESFFLKNNSVRMQYHRQLASLFTEIMQDNITNDRVLSELPWHLEKSEQYEKLADFLCDIRVVDQMCTETYSFELRQYWRALEAMGKNVEVEYVKVLHRAQFPPAIVRADLLFKVANFFLDMTKYDSAEKMFLLARSHYENSSSTLDLAKVDYALGNLYSVRGKHNQALVCLKRCLQCHEQEGGESIEQAMAMERLGTVYMNSRKMEESKEILKRALSLCERKFGTNNNTTADILYNLGCIAFADAKSGQGGVDQLKAEELLRKSLDIKASLLGDWHPEVARVLNRLASIFIEQNQFNDAEACYEQALLIRIEKMGKHHTRVLQTLKHMISCYEMQEKHSEALDCSIRSKEITDLLFGERSEESVSISIRMGILYWLMNKKKEGLDSLMAAKRIRTISFGADSSQVKEIDDTIADLSGALNPPPPPPPPPKNFVLPPPPPAMKPNVQVALGADGIPLPPPPPPPGKKKMQIPKRTAAAAAVVELLQDIQQQKQGLMKQQIFHDRSDAKAQAACMLGRQKRKMVLRKLK